MNVKRKTFITIILSGLALIVVTSVVFYFSYYGYIDKNMEKQIEESYKTIDYILENEKENLHITIADWAQWDDTFQFIQDSNQEYIDSNLTAGALLTLKLKMMIFLDNNKNLVYEANQGIQSDISESLKNELISKDKAAINKEGFLIVGNRTFLIAEAPITKTGQTTGATGTLIMVREIDEKLSNYINNVAKIKLMIKDSQETNNSYYKNYKEIEDKIKIQKENNNFDAYKIVPDIYGSNAIMIEVKVDYSDQVNANKYYRIFSLLVIGANIIIFFLIYMIMDKKVLRRLSKLTSFVEKVNMTKDTSLKLEMDGSDEIYNLAKTTNNMLSSLDAAYKDMKMADERFRIIMEATSDGYLDSYIKTKEVYISPEWKNLIGYVGEDVSKLLDWYMSKVHPECRLRVQNSYKDILNGKSDYFAEEYMLVKENGETIWVLQRGKVAQKDSNGLPIRIISTLSDITDRKKYEEETLFLSYSDKLTGLKNRAFMELEFNKLDNNKESRYSIIIGDINGLTLTNDSLGYKEGDRLLKVVTNILEEACETDCIISRWGGDEFVILAYNNNREYVTSLADNIRKACNEIEGFNFQISIALGYAVKDEENPDTEYVMSLAEKRMYRNKLMDKRSCRGAVISSLLKTLHEKHTETEHHTMRIRYLSSKLGKRIGLSKDKLDELELLSLLHDIGKIGIPEHILTKPSKLTDEEWTIMKTHCDIGYRIAKSTSELSHIANEILCHHERYDGKGYPNGLSGEDIPILSRIINIIDSYDVMTHKRVYKDASSVDYAIEELKRCSGGQFDPNIVEEFLKLLSEKDKKE